MRERRSLALLLLTTAFLFGVAAFGRLDETVSPDSSSQTNAAESPVTASTAEPREGLSRVERHRRLASSMWWHRGPVAEDLGLSTDQQAAMDRLLLDFLKQRDQPVGRELRQQFRASLGRGDLGDAEQTLNQLATEVAAVSLAEARFKLAVLALLEPQQMAAAVERRPKLLTARWLLQLGNRRGSGQQNEAAKEGGE